MGQDEEGVTNAIALHSTQPGRAQYQQKGDEHLQTAIVKNATGLGQDGEHDNPDFGADNGTGKNSMKKATDPLDDTIQHPSKGRDLKCHSPTESAGGNQSESCNDSSDSEYEDAHSTFETAVELEEGELDTSDEDDNKSSSNDIPIKDTLPPSSSPKSTSSHMYTMKPTRRQQRQRRGQYLARPDMRRAPSLHYVDMRPSPAHTFNYLHYSNLHPQRPPYYPPPMQSNIRYQPYLSAYQQRQQHYLQWLQSTARPPPRPIHSYPRKRN